MPNCDLRRINGLGRSSDSNARPYALRKAGGPFFRRYLSPDESITKKYSQGPAPMFVKE
jgi:hypothetical protein